MKALLNVLLILIMGVTTCFGQKSNFDFDKIRLRGLGYYSSKEAIVQKFGKPNKVTEPKYECGAHSEEVQGKKFYQLHYGPIVFIGNEKDKYGIETIEFSPDGTQVLEYGKWKLNGKTTLKDFAQIFGKEAIDDLQEYTEGEIGGTLFSYDSDDGISFYFKSGRLVRIEHFSLC